MPQLGSNAGLLTGYLANRRYAIASPLLRGRVLDYGCATGLLTQWCKPDAYLGVDIDQESIDSARDIHPEYKFDTALPDGELFDTVVALALIEHIKQPASLLETFASALRPGGQILLTTPHPRMEWAHTAGAKVGLFSHEAHEEHEDLIDLPKMKQFAAQVGLKVDRYKRFLFGANQLFVLTRA